MQEILHVLEGGEWAAHGEGHGLPVGGAGDGHAVLLRDAHLQEGAVPAAAGGGARADEVRRADVLAFEAGTGLLGGERRWKMGWGTWKIFLCFFLQFRWRMLR